MFNTDQDTNWTLSAKGNFWRLFDGVVLVVGPRKKGGGFWVRVGDDFVDGRFETKNDAKAAAESAAKNRPRKNIFTDEVEE